MFYLVVEDDIDVVFAAKRVHEGEFDALPVLLSHDLTFDAELVRHLIEHMEDVLDLMGAYSGREGVLVISRDAAGMVRGAGADLPFMWVLGEDEKALPEECSALVEGKDALWMEGEDPPLLKVVKKL